MVEVFSIGFLEKEDDHCHFHIGFVIGIIVLQRFYSIESTEEIPVNLKIGYESTVLSSRDGAIVREHRVNTEGQTYLVCK
jgi:hypothetical protein